MMEPCGILPSHRHPDRTPKADPVFIPPGLQHLELRQIIASFLPVLDEQLLHGMQELRVKLSHLRHHQAMTRGTTEIGEYA